MGYASRANLRSTDGGKPRAFASLHRAWRAVGYFHGDRSGFERWLALKPLSDAQRTMLERIWSEQHPA